MQTKYKHSVGCDLSMISARTCCSPAHGSLLFFLFTLFSGLAKKMRRTSKMFTYSPVGYHKNQVNFDPLCMCTIHITVYVTLIEFKMDW